MNSPEYWFRIISELEARMSLNAIALEVGSSDSSLCRYKAGMGEPRDSIAQALRKLYGSIYPANEM